MTLQNIVTDLRMCAWWESKKDPIEFGKCLSLSDLLAAMPRLQDRQLYDNGIWMLVVAVHIGAIRLKSISDVFLRAQVDVAHRAHKLMQQIENKPVAAISYQEAQDFLDAVVAVGVYSRISRRDRVHRAGRRAIDVVFPQLQQADRYKRLREWLQALSMNVIATSVDPVKYYAAFGKQYKQPSCLR